MPRCLNHYFCVDCNLHWQSEWDCACDDRCPGCRTPYTPTHSDTLGDVVKITGNTVAGYRWQLDDGETSKPFRTVEAARLDAVAACAFAHVEVTVTPIHCPLCDAERGVAIPAHCPHVENA